MFAIVSTLKKINSVPKLMIFFTLDFFEKLP